ncbi:purine-cytosine permease family protein [Curtobacterium sp. PsM8]|uniref:purine-cytosine permease family protein n=1 Tax=Curtobacterium sp. PsM8 TaxID=3030532 RepID=UPI00263AEDF6|nr:cytosine permease [Curtobacterium sp. PsM8]MDN4647219.1 cytosine permease [Curtobacterium sp. PsM8]
MSADPTAPQKPVADRAGAGQTGIGQTGIGQTGAGQTRAVERQGIDVIAESERKGRPRGLFWPWFAANISVLGLAYGSFVLDFGISLAQATLVSVVGVVFSFLLCGIVAIAGKRGSAPTMVLSRAAFGVHGNRLPSFLSWVLTVGWETALAALAVLATSTVFQALGWDDGVLTKLVALVVVAALVVGAGIAGFDVIMRMQAWITVVTGVLTVVYVVLAFPSIDFGTLAALPSGSAQNVIGALVLVMTGFGLGWVNAAADYSRYLPRSSSTGGVVGWTTFGGALAPAVLVVIGVMLAGSSKELHGAISADPIGALVTVMPTWFLVPFAVVAILGLVGGAVLDIYSSGLALLSAGVRIPRPVAAGVDGVLMVAGAVFVVFFATDFIGPFQAFLITLGVPIAAWCGVFVADVLLRRRAYAEDELDSPRGRYGSVRWAAIALVVVGSVLGWGLVTNSTPGAELVHWQGFLLGPFGLGGVSGPWAYANLGVLVALVVGFLGTLLLGGRAVRRQEALPVTEPVSRVPDAELRP